MDVQQSHPNFGLQSCVAMSSTASCQGDPNPAVWRQPPNDWMASAEPGFVKTLSSPSSPARTGLHWCGRVRAYLRSTMASEWLVLVTESKCVLLYSFRNLNLLSIVVSSHVSAIVKSRLLPEARSLRDEDAKFQDPHLDDRSPEPGSLHIHPRRRSLLFCIGLQSVPCP